ncbi:hypothetical protein JCM10212_002611 [Sporobolomyces blumeae]
MSRRPAASHHSTPHFKAEVMRLAPLLTRHQNIPPGGLPYAQGMSKYLKRIPETTWTEMDLLRRPGVRHRDGSDFTWTQRVLELLHNATAKVKPRPNPLGHFWALKDELDKFHHACNSSRTDGFLLIRAEVEQLPNETSNPALEDLICLRRTLLDLAEKDYRRLEACPSGLETSSQHRMMESQVLRSELGFLVAEVSSSGDHTASILMRVNKLMPRLHHFLGQSWDQRWNNHARALNFPINRLFHVKGYNPGKAPFAQPPPYNAFQQLVRRAELRADDPWSWKVLHDGLLKLLRAQWAALEGRQETAKIYSLSKDVIEQLELHRESEEYDDVTHTEISDLSAAIESICVRRVRIDRPSRFLVLTPHLTAPSTGSLLDFVIKRLDSMTSNPSTTSHQHHAMLPPPVPPHARLERVISALELGEHDPAELCTLVGDLDRLSASQLERLFTEKHDGGPHSKWNGKSYGEAVKHHLKDLAPYLPQARHTKNKHDHAIKAISKAFSGTPVWSTIISTSRLERPIFRLFRQSVERIDGEEPDPASWRIAHEALLELTHADWTALATKHPDDHATWRVADWVKQLGTKVEAFRFEEYDEAAHDSINQLVGHINGLCIYDKAEENHSPLSDEDEMALSLSHRRLEHSPFRVQGRRSFARW